MRRMPKLGLVVLGAMLAACAASEPSTREMAQAPEVFSSWEEGCEDTRSVVLLCDEEGGDECGLFLCREVVFDEVLLASRGGSFSRPVVRPTARRARDGQLRGPRDAKPVLTFRFYRSFDPPPRQPPQLLLPPGRFVRHHIFSQAEDLARWFVARGVRNIHQFTMVIPEHLHRQIHGGGPSGGLWNEAWRRFRDDNRLATPEAIYRHAGELIFRFELTGPIVPYYSGRRR